MYTVYTKSITKMQLCNFVSSHYHTYCAIFDVCYIIMPRKALQLLEEWLCCMQHYSSEIRVVASSNF